LPGASWLREHRRRATVGAFDGNDAKEWTVKKAAGLFALGLLCSPALADEATVTMHAISAQGVGQPIGTVFLDDTADGLRLRTELKGLKPGAHGFHVHENGDCGPGMKDGERAAGIAAGGHFSPHGSEQHEGPRGDGHLGDLPLLMADANGNADKTLTAPRLKVAAIKGRALMIHAGGDNYSDKPEPLGGGGARVACGVIGK